MITQIRKGMKSRTFRLVLLFFAVALAGGAALIELVVRQFESSSWALKVNGNPVPANYYAYMVQKQTNFIELLKRQYGDLAEILLQMSGLPTNPGALAEREIVQNAIINQQASDAHIKPSSKTVNEVLALPEKREMILTQVIPHALFGPGGTIDNQALDAYLRAFKLDEKDIKALLSNAVARDMFFSLLSGLTYVPHFYLNHERFLQSADRVLTIATKHFSLTDAPINDESLEAFYTKQVAHGAYEIPEKRSATIWKFDPSHFNLKVSPEQIQQYYNSHKEEFLKEPTKITVQYALFKTNKDHDEQSVKSYAQELHDAVIKDPASFEKRVEQAVSDGFDVTLETSNPIAKGELASEFGAEFDRKVMTLPADNAFTPVIETDDGILLAKRISKVNRTYKDLELAEQEIKNILLQDKFEKRFVQEARAARDAAKSSPEELDEFIKTNQGIRQDFTLAALGDGHYDKYVFSADPEFYTPYLDGQVGLLVKINELTPSTTQSLDEIRNTVKQDFATKQAKETVIVQAQALEKEIREAGTDELDTIIKNHGFTPHSVTFSSSDSDEGAEELGQYGVSGQEALKLLYVGDTVASRSPEEIEKSAYVVVLKDFIGKEGADKPKDDELLFNLKKRYELIQGLQGGFVASLRENAKIETNSSIPSSV